jgi:segregation and condensation protein B
MAQPELRHILEGALLAAGEALSVDRLRTLFPEDARPEPAEIRKALEWLARDYDGRGIELREVAGGYRIQVRELLAPWVSRLWEEKPARYSRALLETLAIIAYRQPITRGEIEDIRGVTVSSSIVRTLQERNWVRTVGHRDVPGRPALLATTRDFLDYFNLKGLDELPSLLDLREFDGDHPELDLRFDAGDAEPDDTETRPGEAHG